MAYLLFMAANAALFVRPAELFPQLGNVQIYLALIACAILCNPRGLHNQVRVRTLFQQPINLCMLGVIAAVPLSGLFSQAGFTTVLPMFIEMLKVGVYYLMLVSVVNTTVRLQRFLMVTAICTTIMVGASILDFQAFRGAWEGNDMVFEQMDKDRALPKDQKVLRHAIDMHGTDALGNPKLVFRMRGLGIFNDPNDVALLIAVAAVICVYFLTDKQLSLARFGWFAPLAVLLYGYVQTQSRGGLLAIGASGMVWLAVRYGGKVAIAIGVMGMLAAPLALGRAADMNVSDGSGQERIQIWGEGLAALKSPAIVFGIGEGQFYDVAGHVAHNSYIHAFVELGFFGGTLFFGCFFLAVYALYRIYRLSWQIRDYELQRLLPYVAALVAAWMVGLATLSRCYTASTYMVVGIAAAYINLVGFHSLRPRPVVVFSPTTARHLVACSGGLLVASFLFVRLFARWGA